MILRIPDYYEDFSCIGGECKESCCIGWELEVDSETYEYYQDVPGPFGDRLRRELISAECEAEDAVPGEEVHSIHLKVDGRCPFLNDKNLCDIVLTLGEESLCYICGNYPRYTFEYGDYIEKCLTISCEEACRLLLSRRDGLKFKEIEMNLGGDFPEDSDYELSPELTFGSEAEMLSEEEYENLTPEEIQEFLESRKALMDMASDRRKSLSERIKSLPGFETFFELRSKEERLRILSLLEPISSGWTDALSNLLAHVEDPDLPWNEIAYENLLMYFLFRYLPRGLYDGDLNTKVRFALFCTYCIRDLENIVHDIRLAASMFSREVEHSDDNIEIIIEELLFN